MSLIVPDVDRAISLGIFRLSSVFARQRPGTVAAPSTYSKRTSFWEQLDN
jgi:hypothetical protein